MSIVVKLIADSFIFFRSSVVIFCVDIFKVSTLHAKSCLINNNIYLYYIL